MPTQRVLYVAGAGHSGSTVLDTLLGNALGVESVGELGQLVRGGDWAAEPCACGASGADCPFWRGVRARFEAEGHVLASLAPLARRFERRAALPLASGRAAYERASAALFTAIAAESGALLVVDSSKSPARAAALARNPALELWLVHLVRDPRAVAVSYAKPKRRDPERGVPADKPGRSPARTALYWRLVNRASERVAERLAPERALRLRYEDYAADPERALAPLLPLVGADLTAVARRAHAGEPLAVGHTIAGNRLRMAGSVRLCADETWRTRLDARATRRVERLSGGRLARYGYAPVAALTPDPPPAGSRTAR